MVIMDANTHTHTQQYTQQQQPSRKEDSMSYRSKGAHAAGITCLGDNVRTEFIAETNLPTADGFFRVRAYRSTGSLREAEPIAIVSGDVSGKSGVPVRVHDQCFTSEVFGSLKCDCREQLDFAKDFIRQHGGVVIYMPQEGRGIGLANKIHAYSMQEKGLDTVDANRVLGFKDDYRSYEPVPAILQDLGIKSIRLLTNNPRKIRLLSQLSVNVEGRLPVIIQGGEHSQGYLSAKAQRMAHLLPGHQPNADLELEDNAMEEFDSTFNPQEAADSASSPTNSSTSSDDDLYARFQYVA
ncbi:hypothetical protein P43SY_009418 [Pythium insidiosum]|uniref:GTP cyclohydrolase II n=1 Tax=Pythium insidiosum TaxID=114742 RepID=A0AAD5MDK8_PYTIN|nr:hypothetical protein P43SY_009418 [Pythium insidiosum]